MCCFFLVRDMLFVEIVGWLYNRNWGVQKKALRDENCNLVQRIGKREQSVMKITIIYIKIAYTKAFEEIPQIFLFPQSSNKFPTEVSLAMLSCCSNISFRLSCYLSSNQLSNYCHQFSTMSNLLHLLVSCYYSTSQGRE